jgi:hypothetical protein
LYFERYRKSKKEAIVQWYGTDHSFDLKKECEKDTTGRGWQTYQVAGFMASNAASAERIQLAEKARGLAVQSKEIGAEHALLRDQCRNIVFVLLVFQDIRLQITGQEVHAIGLQFEIIVAAQMATLEAGVATLQVSVPNVLVELAHAFVVHHMEFGPIGQ